jgi:hypothetical protein
MLDVSQFCVEEVIELCAAHSNVSDAHYIVICIYRSPAGNFNEFFNLLDAILEHLYKPRTEFLLSGDLNVSNLIDSNWKLQLPVLLQTYNMAQSVDIPTIIHKTSSRAVDNIFNDYNRINFFKISPLINGYLITTHNILF